MIYASASATFEARSEGFPTGLTGTIGVRVLDNLGSTTTARATAGISEDPAGSGSYVVTLTAPAAAGQYSVFWDTGTVSPSTIASEDLVVVSTAQVQVVSGTFTYDVTTTLGKVRLEIGDTDSTAILFTDDEINVYLDNRSDSILLAAADLCDQLATRFARAYNFATDGQKFDRAAMTKAYQDRAKALRARAQSIVTVTSTRIDGYSDDVGNRDVGETATNPRRRFYGDPDRIP